METEKYFEQIVSWEGLSYEDKLWIIKEMVHWKIFKAIQEHTVIAKATWENILFQVTTGETDNYNLGTERLLKIIWATDIKVSSKKKQEMWW